MQNPNSDRNRDGIFFGFGLTVLAIASVLRLLIVTTRVWPYTVDDAFITFRYAGNLARGWGLTFNHTPPRAEGATAFLWTLMMALPQRMGLSAISASKILGLVFTVAAIVTVVTAVFRVEAGAPRSTRVAGAAVAGLLFLSFPGVAVHAISGMETALAACLYAAVTTLFCLAPRTGSRWLWRLPACCLLLALTRPEANLFCGAVLVFAWVSVPRERRTALLLSSLGAYLAPGLIYMAWRLHYYGLFWPLSFYAKSDRGGVPGLFVTLGFLKSLTAVFAIPLFVALALRRRLTCGLLVPAGLVVAYFTTVDQVMGFDYRYLYPLVPVFSIVGGVGVTALVADGRLRFGRKRVLRNAALLAVMAAIAWSLARQGTRASDVEAYRAYGAGLRRANLLLGDALGAVAWQTPDPVLALTDAGAVPYLSRLTTIDLFSLNEPYLVTHPNADRAAYLRAMHPTVVVLVSRRPDAFVAVFPYERGVHDALLEQGFTSRATFKFDDTYYLWVLWRPDGPDAPALESILSAASRRSHAMAGLRLVPARSQTEEASGRVSSHAVNDGRAWSMR